MPPDARHLATAIKAHAASLGFAACGFAQTRPVADPARRHYARWLELGRHGCMAWAERYTDVRNDPRRLLDGARTVIMLAMNYRPPRLQPAHAPQFATYAYGRDYHEVMRGRLRALADHIHSLAPCTCRCCVDTAPLRERYWAQQAGLGFVGLNNQLIIPGCGSYHFLGAVVTTLALPPDTPCTLTCGQCGACLAACPTQALDGHGAADARRCLSCLTIELRGPLPGWAGQAMGNRVYGCDACQQCCPHNHQAMPTTIAELQPSDAFMRLTAADIRQMDAEGFDRLFGHSAVKRTRLDGLQRNMAAIDQAAATGSEPPRLGLSTKNR